MNESYTSFAQVYDMFMDNVDYPAWSKYLIQLLKEYQVEDGLVLDLGCGTGNMTELLAKEASETVIDLEHDGVAFSRTEDGHIAQRRFGGHTKDFGKEPVRRAAYAADRIGHQILFSLWQQCVAEGVEFAEEWYVTRTRARRMPSTHAMC